RLAGQEQFTDNVLLTPTDRRSDFITIVQPGLFVSDDSERFKGNLDYSPALYYYAITPGQNVIGHNLYGNGTAALLPDHLFIDARAYASVQPSNVGLATGAGALHPTIGPNVVNSPIGIPSSQLSQTATFSLSPYFIERFDGYGTAQLRYTLT